MWIRHFHIFILLLLPHVYFSAIFIPPEDLKNKALANYRNSTKDNNSTRKVDSMMCGTTFRKRSEIKSLQCSFADPNFVITEPVCTGRCVQGTQRYRCRPDKKKTETIKMLCHPNSSLMTIEVKIVESCKWVKLTNKKRRKRKNRKRKNKKKGNKTDRNKNKDDRKRRRRKNRRHKKHKKSSKLTNNDRWGIFIWHLRKFFNLIGDMVYNTRAWDWPHSSTLTGVLYNMCSELRNMCSDCRTEASITLFLCQMAN